MEFSGTLSARQRRWLADSNVPKGHKMAFMAKGPSASMPSVDRERRARHRPVIRGVVVGAADFADAGAARSAADAALSDLRDDVEPFSDAEELALGIASANSILADRAQAAMVLANRVVHVGSAIGAMGREGVFWHLEKPIDAILGYGPEDPIWTVLSYPQANPNADLDEAVGEVIDQIIERGLLGFLVEAETPVLQLRPDGSCGRSWNLKAVRWVYGETFEEAFARAEAWAAGEHERQRENAAERHANGRASA